MSVRSFDLAGREASASSRARVGYHRDNVFVVFHFKSQDLFALVKIIYSVVFLYILPTLNRSVSQSKIMCKM